MALWDLHPSAVAWKPVVGQLLSFIKKVCVVFIGEIMLINKVSKLLYP